MRQLIFIMAVSVLFLCCLEQTGQHTSSGASLAETYCGTCHQLPAPALLDKKTWETSVLPLMAGKLGISSYNGKYIAVAQESADNSSFISYSEWISIVDYYVSQAPDTLPGQERPPVKEVTNRFESQPVSAPGVNPSICMVKIDPGNKLIYAASMYDSLFLIFDRNMRIKQKLQTGKVFVDMDFGQNITTPGNRTGILTNIGNFFPNEKAEGSLEAFEYSGSTLLLGAQLFNNIPRPIAALHEDLDNDGKKEIVVSAFGHEKGELFLLVKPDSGDYQKTSLRSFPGPNKPWIVDFNNDGRKDILSLFSQGNEGIFLFTAQQEKKFTDSQLIKFSPLNGSSYMELADMNGDGLKDILYTCGDNYDYSRILKNYHGIYIFINKGDNHFVQQYFFPVHGCYKAISKDFDNDGDADIASISFFPDTTNQPQESFIYLENSGNMRFSPSTIAGSVTGRWLTMDAGDVDGDGDEDIVLGSMVLGNTATRTNDNSKKTSLLLLRNRSKN